MAVRGLEQTTTRLDQAKRLGGLILVAVILAALVVGALILTGLFRFTPTPQVRVLGFIVPPTWTAFFGSFTLALTLIIAYVYFAQLILSSIEKAKDFWFDLPVWLQAFILGLLAGVVAGLGLVLSDRYIYPFGLLPILAVGAGVGIPVMYLTIQLRDRGWTLFEWTRTLFTGALIGGVVAVLTGLAFAGVTPGYTPAAVFLIGWGICTYLLFRRRHTIEDSLITRLLTRTGYAQMRQVETIPISVATGIVLAFVVAAIVGIAGTTPESTVQRVLFSILLVWPVVTLATSVGWPNHERTDLVIDDINVRSSTEQRELTIRNLGDWPVNLRRAKITDANNTLYQFEINVSLGAGEAAKFEIPEMFDLAMNDRYDVFSFPFGLVLTREGTEPRIITRNGREYKLLWIDQVSESHAIA